MRLGLYKKDILQAVPGLVSELEQLVDRINIWSDAQHDPQTGAHTDVTLDTLDFNAGSSQSTVGAAGGASALPATPALYQSVFVDGVEYVMPLYAKS